MELDRERQSANQASSTSLVLGSWHEQASSRARSAGGQDGGGLSAAQYTARRQRLAMANAQ